MVGRAPAKTVDEIFKVIKSQFVFQDNGRILTKSDKIWKTCSNKLNNCLKSETLYCYVRDNWQGLKDRLLEYYSNNKKYD